MIKKIFPILAISIFSSMLGAGIIAPLLPQYADSMGATGIWLGVIFAGFAISRALFTPIIGNISDRRGRKVFLCTGLFAYAVISLGYIWVGRVAELAFVRLIHGFASAMIIPIAQAYVGELSPEGEEGTWMGYFNAAFVAGFGFGPLMGGILAQYFGMDSAFYTMGGLNLMAFILALSLLPEIRLERDRREDSQHPLPKMRESGMMKGLFSFRLLYAFGRSAFTAFLPLFGARQLGLTSGQTGTLLAVYMLLISISLVFSGKIADRFSRKGMAIIGSLISITFLALIPEMQSFWQLLGLCLFGGIGGTLFMPASAALAVEEGRKYGMGSVMGVFTMAMSLGMAAGPILGGVAADYLDLNSVFYLGSGTTFLGIVLFIWFTR
jgi:MFS family permease